MHRRVALAVLVAGLWSPAAGFGQERGPLVLTLAEAERLALQNNAIVRMAGAEVDLSRAKKSRAAHARVLPKFNLRNVWGPIPRARGVFTKTGVLTSPDTSTGFSDLRFFTQVDLDIVQPLWTFGRLSGLDRAAGFGVEAAEADLSTKTAELRLQVRETYWALVLGYELLEVVDDMSEDAEEARAKLQELFDEGSEQVTQNDLFKFRIFEYDIHKARRQALDRIELGTAALRAAIGLDEATEITLETRELVPLEVTLDSLPTYTAMALRNRPEIAGLRAGIHASSSLVSVARSEHLPQLFFAANLRYNRAPSRFDSNNPFVYNPTNFFNPGIVVGFNWNLNVLQTRDKISEARYELARLTERESPLLDGIRLEVRKSYLAMRQAEANMQESRRALTASENWLRAETQTFDLGMGEVKDVIDAFRANAAMRREYLQNIFAFNTALAALGKAIGRDLYPG
ncbi:MAG: TolC family protein [Gemmatimonadota bacterium]